MKNIVIAAGYATRLGELTANFPKPLLKIGSNTILGRMLDDIDQISDIDEHIIVTNHRFASIFEDWAKERTLSSSPLKGERKPITIVDDGTTSNENRLGAVRDLQFAIEFLNKRGWNATSPFKGDERGSDMLVVAADNLLFFSFQGFLISQKRRGHHVLSAMSSLLSRSFSELVL